jgi:exodeoxyribonuclease VII large subunit
VTASLFGADEPGAVRRVSLVRLSSEIARSVAAVGRVLVEGEVHRPSRGGGGAVYFTLKDRAAQVAVCCPSNRSARCRAVAGERVAVTGFLSWSADRGQLTLMADEVVPVGAGAIAAMVADARRRLAADGLLDRPRHPLPRLPRVIGVVCGADAAVRADIESVVADRFPGYPVDFAEVPVSGPGAVDAIMRALAVFDGRPEVDVVVLARGGGDATQLLPFSAEELCRAICACRTPVVSAVGHEGDRPLCDEVADRRFGTPSLAAAAVVPSRARLEEDLSRLAATLARVAGERLAAAGRRLAAVDRGAALVAGLATAGSRLDRAGLRLAHSHPDRLVVASAARLEAQRRQLEALSPARVLERGYAVVRLAAGGAGAGAGPGGGAVVREAGAVERGAAIEVQLARGRLQATVDAVEDGSGRG